MRIAVVLCAMAALAGCGGEAPKQAEAPKKKAPAAMPAVWKARIETTQGPFVIEVNKAWAPRGAERFWKLVTAGFFDDSRFFRVRPGFIVQFGMAGDPAVNSLMGSTVIEDDPFQEKNLKGTVAFAQLGRNTRSTQVYINLKDNAELDRAKFAPFGRVVEGMEVVEKLYGGYGEWSPPGRGPEAARIQRQGNRYLDAQFPRLDKLKRASVVVE
jgi:peptidyl-prolyl cis-trans isomerase A (cyclophilin A)